MVRLLINNKNTSVLLKALVSDRLQEIDYMVVYESSFS